MSFSIATIIALVFAIIVAFLLLVPDMKWLRRMLGYMVITDIAASGYVVATYAATGAVSGLTLAIFAALGISLTMRLLRMIFGTEKLAVEGGTGLRGVFAEFLSSTSHWISAFAKSLFTGGKVTAPAAMNVEWKREEGWFVVKAREFWAYFSELLQEKLGEHILGQMFATE